MGISAFQETPTQARILLYKDGVEKINSLITLVLDHSNRGIEI